MKAVGPKTANGKAEINLREGSESDGHLREHLNIRCAAYTVEFWAGHEQDGQHLAPS